VYAGDVERLAFAALPDRPAAGRDDVHLVRIALDAGDDVVARLAAILDDEERARVGRYLFDRDRRRFTVARATLRIVLGRYLGRAPEAVRFDTAERGKPFLVDGGPHFNLSHSGERALLAVSPARELGVDIERHRPSVDFLEVARHSFSPAEQRALAALPPDQIPDAFFRCWARKESFIKARGDGLYFPLDGFDVSLEPAPAVALLACPAAPEAMARWVMRPLDVEPGYAAALTVEGDGFAITAYDAPAYHGAR